MICSVLQCVACVAVRYSALLCGAVRTQVSAQCVAVCCSVLQCVAVCCSVLQCVAVCCSVLVSAQRLIASKYIRTSISIHLRYRYVLLRVAACCSVLLCVAVCCSCCCVLQCAAVCCSVLQCVAVCCSTHTSLC